MTISKDRGLNDQSPTHGGEFASRPAWSIQSLHELNEAVRWGRRFDDPWRLRQEAERTASDTTRAMRAYEGKASEAARAEREH